MFIFELFLLSYMFVWVVYRLTNSSKMVEDSVFYHEWNAKVYMLMHNDVKMRTRCVRVHSY